MAGQICYIPEVQMSTMSHTVKPTMCLPVMDVQEQVLAPDRNYNMCRICGIKNSANILIPIFPVTMSKNERFHNLAAIIAKYLPIKISVHDCLPSNICYHCANILVSWQNLVEKCIKLDEDLKIQLQIETNEEHIESQKPLLRTDGIHRIPQNGRSIHHLNSPLRVLSNKDSHVEDDTLLLVCENYSKLLNNSANSYLIPQQDNCKGTDELRCTDDTSEPRKSDRLARLESLHDQLNTFVDHLKINIKKHHGDMETLETLENSIDYSDVVSCKSELSIFGDDSFEESSMEQFDRIKTIHLKKSIHKSSKKRKLKYSCNDCNLIFKTNKGLTRHKKNHSKKKGLYSCKMCLIKFKEKVDLKYHVTIDHADLSLDQKPTFIRHKDKVIDYKEIEKVEVTVDGVKYYQCQVCRKNLQRLYSYLTHASIHTGEKEYVCHLCGKQFRLSTTLQVHMKYTHEGIKDASCDICAKQFATRKNMIQHRRIHTGERPYICQTCGKTFKQSASLYIHKRTHTDVFPYKCSQCNTRYRIKSQLKYHMIKHTGENPFPCDVCGKACATMSHLNYHKKCAHIKGKPFRCTECDKAFRQKKYLRQHIKCCHKI